MAIKSIKIESFTVFEDIEIDFNPDVNILIGENGTGKTHLLKLLYVLSYYYKPYNGEDDITQRSIFHKLRAMFPVKSIINLVRNNNDFSNVSLDSDNYSSYFSIKDRFTSAGGEGEKSTIFIPAKEMLMHSKGLPQVAKEYRMPFDDTHLDIIEKALFPLAIEIPKMVKNILLKLEKIMDGIVVVEDNEFFIEKFDGTRIPFLLEAEGVKKIALLWQLLSNKRITNDTILFWDEPEANVNPKMIPLLVDILLELSRNGVQIFLATHDYNFIRYFDIMKQNNDTVSFYSLYKTENGVQCEKQDKYNYLDNNPIIEANIQLLDESVEGFV